ncbi:hypothetical protein [Amycolatopsis sp. NPDC051372]|uniref:hypothetical protein n=1 Tax=Amycolatopsis sp. NPDC051372 TaxID=3155669 RepID=UPI003432AA99
MSTVPLSVRPGGAPSTPRVGPVRRWWAAATGLAGWATLLFGYVQSLQSAIDAAHR